MLFEKKVIVVLRTMLKFKVLRILKKKAKRMGKKIHFEYTVKIGLGE